MWYSESLGVIKTPRALTVNDVQHPANIFRVWSKAELAEVGIYALEVTTPDTRYLNTGSEVINKVEARNPDGTFSDATDWYEMTYVTTDKDVEPLKVKLVSDIKSQVGALLAPTDWKVIREMDGGTAMSDEFKTWRSQVRQHGNALESGVDSFASLDAIKAFEQHNVVEVRYVSTYDNDGNETIGPGTEEVARTVSKVTWGWPVSPDAEADPYHVEWK